MKVVQMLGDFFEEAAQQWNNSNTKFWWVVRGEGIFFTLSVGGYMAFGAMLLCGAEVPRYVDAMMVLLMSVQMLVMRWTR